MKRIITTALIILTIGSTFILNEEKAQPQVRRCSLPSPSNKQDPANHLNAYNDGYRQGVESARKGEQYRQRVVGGEFARGFKDGYENRIPDAHSYEEPTFRCDEVPGTPEFQEREREREREFQRQNRLNEQMNERFRERQRNRN